MTNIMLHGPPLIRLNSSQDGTLKPPGQPLASASKKKSKSQKAAVLQPLSSAVRGLRDASNVLLSWRDGMTESEREDRRRAEQRMQILAARMQNVSRQVLLFMGLLLTNMSRSGHDHEGMGDGRQGTRLP